MSIVQWKNPGNEPVHYSNVISVSYARTAIQRCGVYNVRDRLDTDAQYVTRDKGPVDRLRVNVTNVDTLTAYTRSRGSVEYQSSM